MTNTAYTGTEVKTYPKKICQEIYKAIRIFLNLADGEWKNKWRKGNVLFNCISFIIVGTSLLPLIYALRSTTNLSQAELF